MLPRDLISLALLADVRMSNVLQNRHKPFLRLPCHCVAIGHFPQLVDFIGRREARTNVQYGSYAPFWGKQSNGFIKSQIRHIMRDWEPVVPISCPINDEITDSANKSAIGKQKFHRQTKVPVAFTKVPQKQLR